MDHKLLYRLKAWRMKQAQKEGVELFRVLPNTTLEEIARVVPKTPEEFFRIKGIKEGRWKKYGAMLLVMVGDSSSPYQGEGTPPRRGGEESRSIFDEQAVVNEALTSPNPLLKEERQCFDDAERVPDIPGQRTLYTVSAFLEALNVLFAEMTVRVKGEVSSVDARDKTIYFSLKDSQDGSVLSCLIFRYHYQVSGVNLEVGQEVVVEGVPEIWKPTGRLSLKAQSMEVSGEGALQKAYNDLKKKLEGEGLFALERKRPLLEFPERIALVTSNQGAAIGDFMMNLGAHGFKISLFNASVEGKRAVFDLIEAVKFFNRHPEEYDVLVIIRGGGSLESLQAFNNETLVREVAQSKIPTLCGIGHEKDVSLAALAGDRMVSTPTATARALRESWERAEALLSRHEREILSAFDAQLRNVRTGIDEAAGFLVARLQAVSQRFARAQQALMRSVEKYAFSIRARSDLLARAESAIMKQYGNMLEVARDRVRYFEEALKHHDPRRLLRLGYSLTMKDGKLLRSTKDVQAGDAITVRLADGDIAAEVK